MDKEARLKRREEIINLYLRGMKQKEIAEYLDVSKSVVSLEICAYKETKAAAEDMAMMSYANGIKALARSLRPGDSVILPSGIRAKVEEKFSHVVLCRDYLGRKYCPPYKDVRRG